MWSKYRANHVDQHTYQVLSKPQHFLRGGGEYFMRFPTSHIKKSPPTRSQCFSDNFQTWQGYQSPLDLRRVRFWWFCLIEYAYNRPFNEPINFGIPGLIFEAKVSKFGTNVGLMMLINIDSGFYHNCQKFLENLQLGALTIIISSLTSVIFLGSFSKMVRSFITLRSQMSLTLEVLTN